MVCFQHLRVKGVGVSKVVKDNCKRQFVNLARIQLEKGQVSAEDMLDADLPEVSLCQ